MAIGGLFDAQQRTRSALRKRVWAMGQSRGRACCPGKVVYPLRAHPPARTPRRTGAGGAQPGPAPRPTCWVPPQEHYRQFPGAKFHRAHQFRPPGKGLPTPCPRRLDRSDLRPPARSGTTWCAPAMGHEVNWLPHAGLRQRGIGGLRVVGRLQGRTAPPSGEGDGHRPFPCVDLALSGAACCPPHTAQASPAADSSSWAAAVPRKPSTSR